MFSFGVAKLAIHPATRPERRVDCNQSALAGFTGAIWFGCIKSNSSLSSPIANYKNRNERDVGGHITPVGRPGMSQRLDSRYRLKPIPKRQQHERENECQRQSQQ